MEEYSPEYSNQYSQEYSPEYSNYIHQSLIIINPIQSTPILHHHFANKDCGERTSNTYARRYLTTIYQTENMLPGGLSKYCPAESPITICMIITMGFV
jgi:hypothetical protein